MERHVRHIFQMFKEKPQKRPIFSDLPPQRGRTIFEALQKNFPKIVATKLEVKALVDGPITFF